MDHAIVDREQWLKARLELLSEEKAFNRARDELSRRRRELPWERVSKSYTFTGPGGPLTLADLFGPHSQLIIYHFMLGPDAQEPCKSCSFWADNFNGIDVHLAHRDVALTLVSRAPLARIAALKARFGWTLNWVSSLASDFNFDYGVSFTPEQVKSGRANYNYREIDNTMGELPGISVFVRAADGTICHSYSCYARGLDMLNGAYHLLDLVPKGRDERGLPYSMSWLRLRDRYE